MRRPLYHLLYTNAPGAGGTGFRHVPVNFPATAGDPAPIQRWLETLQQVAAGAREGWAFHSFGIDRSLFAALAVVNPSFSPEEHGRGRTVLVHALLLPLLEGQRVDHFGSALYEKAKSFLDVGRDNYQSSLDWYLGGFATSNDLDVPEPDLRSLRELDPGFLARLFAAADGNAGRVAFPGIAADDLLPDRILLASAVLPPRLRLQMRWRVGLPSAPEGFVAFTGEDEAGPPPAGPTPAGRGAVFGDQVERALRDQRFDALCQISQDWEIRDWDRLVEAIRTLEDRPAVVAVAPQLGDSEEMEMAKKRPVTGGDKPAASRPGKSPAAYDEEYQSLQKNLEEYVNRRLANLRGGDGPPVADLFAGGARSPHSLWARLVAWRPELYLALVLLLLGWLHCSRP